MDSLTQTLLTAVGASGVLGIIFTVIITKKVNQEFEKIDRQEKARDDNMFLLMSRVDNTAEMTHLMAKKLHDAGVINGDLGELEKKYKQLNDRYNDNLRSLAVSVLNKR